MRQKEFKRECQKDLKELEYNTEKTFKTIKRLIKKAVKLNILREWNQENF